MSTVAIMAPDTRPPSGAQHEIRHGDQVAVVTEVGATLRRYDVGGRPVVQGHDVDAVPDGSRGQVLVPWPNRVADGRYSWRGTDLQLPLTEVPKRNAIHGLVRWQSWQLDDRDDASVSLTATVWPTPGYPFLLAVSATYRLDDEGLSVELRSRNDGADAAPYGVGQHPYLVTSAGRADDVTLTVPARTRMLVDERSNPAGQEDVAGTEYDFRTPRRIGEQVLDTAFTDLVPDEDGWVRVRLDDPDGEWRRAARRADHPMAAGLHRRHPRAPTPADRGGGGADVLPARRLRVRCRPGDPGARRRAPACLGPARQVRPAGRRASVTAVTGPWILTWTTWAEMS